MDIKQYYQDLNDEAAELRKKHPKNEVYITSVFHRERNSTPGNVLSATIMNAARVITDGTHRVSTPDEVQEFKDRQQEQLMQFAEQEQRKQQKILVVTSSNPNDAGVSRPSAMVSRASEDIKK